MNGFLKFAGGMLTGVIATYLLVGYTISKASPTWLNIQYACK